MIKKKIIEEMLREFGSIYKMIQNIYKRLDEKKGDIRAEIELTQLKPYVWRLTIAGKDGSQSTLSGDLGYIFHMANVFSRIYDWDKKEEDKKDDSL